MTIPDLDGATDPGRDDSWPANPGEYAARWNAVDQERRAQHVRGVADDGVKAMNCWAGQHDIQIQMLRGRVRQLPAEQDAAEAALAGCRQSLAAVGGAADLARTQALADALEVVETYGDRAAISSLRDYIDAEGDRP